MVLDNDYVVDGRVIKEIKIFEKLDIDYRILCYDFGKEYKEDSRIIRIPNGRFIKNKLQAVVNTFPIAKYIWTYCIKNVVKEFKPDFIHVHDLYMFPPAYSAVKNSQIKIPITLDLHENYPFAIQTYAFVNRGINRFLVRPNRWFKKEKDILKKANSIIVLSKSFEKTLRERCQLEDNVNILEFPNYPDYIELDARLPINPEVLLKGKICLYFGVISKERGITKIIQAVNFINYHFRFV